MNQYCKSTLELQKYKPYKKLARRLARPWETMHYSCKMSCKNLARKTMTLQESCKTDIDLARILQDRHWPCKNLARQTLTLQESRKEDNELARKTIYNSCKSKCYEETSQGGLVRLFKRIATNHFCRAFTKLYVALNSVLGTADRYRTLLAS